MYVYMYIHTRVLHFTSSSLSNRYTRIVATQDHPIFGTPMIRHSNCSILIPASQTSDRCKPCQKFRPALRSNVSKLNQSGARGSSVEHKTDPLGHTPYRCLTKDELTDRLRQLSVLHARTARQLRQLESKLEVAIDTAGHTMNDHMHSDLVGIMEKQNTLICTSYPPGSFLVFSGSSSSRFPGCRDTRGMRWHPLMIKWALYLHHQSSGAYETLRSLGCVTLPSQRTLRDYTHDFKACVGSLIKLIGS